MHCDSRPGAQLGEAVQAALFTHHPYGMPVIGWGHEIEGLGREDALAYYRRFYTPGERHPHRRRRREPRTRRCGSPQETYGKIRAARRSRRRAAARASRRPVANRLVTVADDKVEQPAWQRVYLVPVLRHRRARGRSGGAGGARPPPRRRPDEPALPRRWSSRSASRGGGRRLLPWRRARRHAASIVYVHARAWRQPRELDAAFDGAGDVRSQRALDAERTGARQDPARRRRDLRAGQPVRPRPLVRRRRWRSARPSRDVEAWPARIEAVTAEAVIDAARRNGSTTAAPSPAILMPPPRRPPAACIAARIASHPHREDVPDGTSCKSTRRLLRLLRRQCRDIVTTPARPQGLAGGGLRGAARRARIRDPRRRGAGPGGRAALATICSRPARRGRRRTRLARPSIARSTRRRSRSASTPIRDKVSGRMRTLRSISTAPASCCALALNAPRFDEEPFERVREQMNAALRHDANDPATLAGRAWSANGLSRATPTAHPADGTLETLDAHRARRPRRACTAGCSRATRLHDRRRRRDRRRAPPAPARRGVRATCRRKAELSRDPDRRPSRRRRRRDDRSRRAAIDDPLRPAGAQRATTPTTSPASSLAHILGGGIGLVLAPVPRGAREARPRLYALFGSFDALDHAPLSHGGTTTKNERARESLRRRSAAEIRDVATERPSARRNLTRARRYLIGSYPLRFDTSTKIAGQLVHIQLDGCAPRMARSSATSAIARGDDGDVKRAAERAVRRRVAQRGDGGQAGRLRNIGFAA